MDIATAEAQTPHLPQDVVSACLDDLVQSIAGRPGVAEGRRYGDSEAIRTMILSVAPHDVAQLMLVGHAVLFSVLIVDDAREVLRGAADAMKRRNQSSIIAMGRMVAKNLETVLRLQGKLGPATRKARAKQETGAPPIDLEPRVAALTQAAAAAYEAQAAGAAYEAPAAGAANEDQETLETETGGSPGAEMAPGEPAGRPDKRLSDQCYPGKAPGWRPSRKTRRLLARQLTRATRAAPSP